MSCHIRTRQDATVRACTQSRSKEDLHRVISAEFSVPCPLHTPSKCGSTNVELFHKLLNIIDDPQSLLLNLLFARSRLLLLTLLLCRLCQRFVSGALIAAMRGSQARESTTARGPRAALTHSARQARFSCSGHSDSRTLRLLARCTRMRQPATKGGCELSQSTYRLLDLRQVIWAWRRIGLLLPMSQA